MTYINRKDRQGFHKVPDGVDPEVVEKVSDNDREWFEKHPDRQYYVRPMIEGEVPANSTIEGDPYILIRSIKPGTRVRLLVGFDPGGYAQGYRPEAAPEYILAEIWAEIMGEPGNQFAKGVKDIYAKYGI